MINHTYNGRTVKVRKGTVKEMDNLARAILGAHDKRQNPNASDHWEVDRMPADMVASDAPKRSRGRPKGSKNAPKVSAPITGEMPGESVTAPAENALYESGHYREPCRVCGLGIPRTGRRGRAPAYHESCRPTESE